MFLVANYNACKWRGDSADIRFDQCRYICWGLSDNVGGVLGSLGLATLTGGLLDICVGCSGRRLGAFCP